ncbi:hypothetical protein NDU88_005107 [Pleurodeles waltl]|uniref:Uncharacterized protein n=1 Tax=Pleurodeles waltl TaxID=8319 RepID=A0AAV7L3E5_PLEWA|nr:hypothetical protein NDU88_005107 [Pleurodeles waltl]
MPHTALGIYKPLLKTSDNELGLDPEDYAILLTDLTHNPAGKREEMAEVMFERFNVHARLMAHQPVLSMYPFGRTTDPVVDCGHCLTQAVPVHEGYVMPHAIQRMNDVCLQLTRYFEKHLQTLMEHKDHIVEDMKRKCCYISIDFDAELKLNAEAHLIHEKLTACHVVSLEKERFEVLESLFSLEGPC